MVRLINKAFLLFLVLLVTPVVTLPVTAHDLQRVVSAGPDNVAIKGYDTVAYFTESKPTKGISEFAFSWYEAEWHFTSAHHRDLFAANPERYAPQFGGYCSMAMSTGWAIDVDPENWEIVDEKLYLVHTKQGIQRFRSKPRHFIKKAETVWANKQQQD